MLEEVNIKEVIALRPIAHFENSVILENMGSKTVTKVSIFYLYVK